MDYRFPSLLILLSLLAAQPALAQNFGVELLNNVMPASGAMGGTSIARPQDVQSAINGNPATMTQYHGTQFALSGVWIEPTYNLTVDMPAPIGFGVMPFENAKSDSQGIAGGNIGITQDISVRGMPATIGLGLMAGAGAGVDFRHIPASNGTHANINALDIIAGFGIDLTDRLSAGATLTLSNATLDGPFVGITGSSSDYAIRGTVGVDYEVTQDTTVGAYWKTKAGYTFENLAAFPLAPRTFLDIDVDRPEIVGLGISNSSLMDGRLLLAMDAVFQNYSDTALFGAIYNDQWALQFGAQYAANDRVRIRLGYAWNENPMRDVVGDSAGGISPPGAGIHVQYIEALFAAIPQHRVTGGVNIRDVLPGVDMSFFAGGMFQESQTFGTTTATVKSYWVGTGLTWHFGCGADKS